MILTDHEWLRFVTFALAAGGVLGAANTGALLLVGWPLDDALVFAAAFMGALALVVHAMLRALLDQATESRAEGEDEQPDDQPTEETTA